MRPMISEARRVGILLLMQMASALIVPFVLFDALKKGYPSFLDTASENAVSIRLGVAIALVGAGLTVAIAITMLRVLRRHSQSAAVFFLTICCVSCTVDLIHSATVLSILSVGVKYANAGGTDTALYQAWGAMAGSLRLSMHIVQLFAIGAWMFTFYLSLFCFRLIPRSLAVLGIAGIVGQFVGVTLMMFIGTNPVVYLAMPLAPIHVAVAIWLIVKGFLRNEAMSENSQRGTISGI